MSVEWRYFSNIGKSYNGGYNYRQKNFSNNYRSYYSDEELDSDIYLEPSDRFLSIVRRYASNPIRVGNVTQAVVIIAKRLSSSNRIWYSRKNLFLKFLISILSEFFKNSYLAFAKKEGFYEPIKDEEFEDYEGDLEVVESEDEYEEGVDLESDLSSEGFVDNAKISAMFMTRQFASFLITTYILMYANRYKIILSQYEEGADDTEVGSRVNSVIRKLLISLGFEVISQDISSYMMHLIRLLKHYLTGSNIEPRRMKIGQSVLSKIVTIITEAVVEVAYEEVRAFSNRTNGRNRDIISAYKRNISRAFSAEENTDKNQEKTDKNKKSKNKKCSKCNEAEKQFARIWNSITPSIKSKAFAKRFLYNIGVSGDGDIRMFSRRDIRDVLYASLYKELSRLFSDKEEAEKAIDDAMVVLDKAALMGLVESLEEAAAKVSELVKEEAEASKDEEGEDNWWEDWEEDEDTDEEDDDDSDESSEEEEEEEEEDVEEDIEEEDTEESEETEESEDSDEEESSEEDEEEETEEENKQSRLSLFSRKGRKKILSKYNSRSTKRIKRI